MVLVTGERGPNTVRHARTRAALLRAGYEQFAQDGFAAARTDGIATRTGLTRGALYHHFPDKTALFDAVVEDIATTLVTRIDAVSERSPSSLEDLRAGCREWLDAMADPTLHRLYLVEAPAALGFARWREIDAAHSGRALREGVEAALSESGDTRADVDALTALLSGALNEAALTIAESDDPAAAGSAFRATLDVLLDRLFGGRDGS